MNADHPVGSRQVCRRIKLLSQWGMASSKTLLAWTGLPVCEGGPIRVLGIWDISRKMKGIRNNSGQNEGYTGYLFVKFWDKWRKTYRG